MRWSKDDAELESWRAERTLIEFGLLDPDQPTPQAHARYRHDLFAEFTPMERAMIRSSLGLIADHERERENR